MSQDGNTSNFVNELPKHTGINGLKHCKISISDVFPDKFYEITYSYIKKLQWVLNQYDVVIFMARKAICFYKALCINDELTPSASCAIYSSRALSYNIWEKINGKSVALVDDVVIRGESLTAAKNILESHRISTDIYISALMCQGEAGSYNNENQLWYDKLCDIIQQPFVFLNETDIYSYANYITRFIEASMLPYNIDQPTALIEYEKEQLKAFMHDHRMTDITSSIQKRFGIENKVIHYSGEILRPVLGSLKINLNEISIKLRIYHDIDNSQLLVFPIILFPVTSKETIDHVYEHIRTIKLDYLAQNGNLKIEEENKAKILIYILTYYILSRFLWCERVHGRNFTYCGLDSNESVLFSEPILCSDYIKPSLSEKISKLTMPYHWEQNTSIRPAFFTEYLGATYVVIFSKMRRRERNDAAKYFLNKEGTVIKKKIFTLQFFYEKLKEYDASKRVQKYGGCNVRSTDEIDICIVSNIIDVLIDRGILVPEIVHTQSGGLVRAYRCGEVAKLNQKEFELFCYMLQYYSTHIWNDEGITALTKSEENSISRREVEQLCVLFFRKAAKNGIFEQINDGADKPYEDDCYSIYYTLFGPIVSRYTQQKYEITNRDKLLTILSTYGYIDKVKNGRISFGCPVHLKIEKKWKRFADVFASEILFLKYCFPSWAVRNSILQSNLLDSKTMLQKSVFSYIHSFDELLTLMSIGENEMQRTLSLVAEMKVIADMKTENLSAMLFYFSNNLNNILEGIWKSSCFVKSDLLEDIQEALKQDKSKRDIADITRIFQEYVDDSSRVDYNSVISEFINQFRDYFYRALYTVSIISKYVPDRINLEARNKIPKRIKYSKQYNEFRDKIAQKYKACSKTMLNQAATADLIDLQHEAMALLDICDLYFEHNAFGYTPYFQSIIVCANNPNILSELELFSRDCSFRLAKAGKIGKNRFFRCFLACKDNSMNKKDMAALLSRNLNAIACSFVRIEKSDIENAEISILYYVTERWYESLLSSGNTCTGKFIELLLNDMSRLERSWQRNNKIELFLCGTPEEIEKEITSTCFSLIEDKRTGVLQNYATSNYGIQIMVPRNVATGNITVCGDVHGNVTGSAYDSTFVGSVII